MEQIALDIGTAKTGLVLQERPVVSLSARIAHAIQVCAESERELALVTPMTSRLTLPLRLMIGPSVRWVVRDEDVTYFDGVSGVPLEWDGEQFVPGKDVYPRFAEGEPDGRQLVVTATVRHSASAGLVIGGLVEAVSRYLTGDAPTGWGTSEPVATPWGLESVTDYCRRRSPRHTWLCHVGGGVGTLQVVPTRGGVEEHAVVGVGLGAEAPVPELAGMLGTVVGRYSLVSMTAQIRPGRRDLLTEARWYGASEPVGLAVEGDGVWHETRTWERFREVLEGREGAGPDVQRRWPIL